MPSDAAKKRAEQKKAASASKRGPASKAGGTSSGKGNEPAAHDSILLVFPPSLTPRQRAVIHAAAEEAGLHHGSTGDGAERRIAIGRQDGNKVQVGSGSGKLLSDAEICSLLLQHLSLDASPHFSSPSSSHGQSQGSGAAAKPRVAAKGHVQASTLTLEDFVLTTQELLELERQAEVDQATEATQLCSPETAQARGRSLLNLRVDDVEGGLMGRTLVTLVANKGYVAGGKAQVQLPQHKFTPHDVVALRPSKGATEAALAEGVVYRVRETAIVVAVDDLPEDGMDQPLRLDKLANEVTYKRLKETLRMLAASSPSSQDCPGRCLIDVMFGKRDPRFVDSPPPWKPFNSNLDESQQRAVGLALAAKDVALIHGPPGTGKTTAVIEVIMQEVARGSRVLAAAASNVAVDNLVERLAAASSKTRIVRMGHPARLLPQVLDNSLEAHVLRSDNSSLAKDCRKDIKALNKKLLKLGPRDRDERRQIRQDLRQLAREERKRQEAAVVEVIKSAQVVACTLTGVLNRDLDKEVFDVVVVDEAAQALEAATWSALLKAPRAVLAGDHLQLPPTVISDDAARRGLSRTLFERLQAMYGSAACEMLTVQYRMNTSIMQWSSDELYQGQLTAHPSVASHTLAGLPAPPAPLAAAADGEAGAAPVPSVLQDQLPVLLLIDSAGCGFDEQQEAEGDSRANPGEAKAVMAHVHVLMKKGVPPSSIGIITPYNAQVALLREMRPERLAGVLEISSVDGFQGREKEALIISMVRSNDKREVGFLSDRRRMNVAVTRARRHCALVCDSETVKEGDDFLNRLVTYFEEHGEYMSASEYVPQ